LLEIVEILHAFGSLNVNVKFVVIAEDDLDTIDETKSVEYIKKNYSEIIYSYIFILILEVRQTTA